MSWEVTSTLEFLPMKSSLRIACAAALLGVLHVGVATASPQIAAKAGCVACHMVDRKLVGPSYKEIAAKYKTRADAIPYLSQRVRKGGPGNWGAIPMAANDVSKLSDADLKAVLTWILKTP
jgi:cytochrome c